MISGGSGTCVCGITCLPAILLVLAAFHATVQAAEEGRVTAVYRGEINHEANRALFRRLAGMPVERLRITSRGGDVEAGIELATWVFDKGLDVEVEGACLSSCANYVFPAGTRKFILPGSVVAWHGNYRHLLETGLWRDDVRARMRKYDEDEETARSRALDRVHRLVRMERAFFRRIDVDEYVCWIGKMPPYDAPDYYFLSVADMARFGIDRVSAPPGYVSADLSGLGVKIVYLRLSDDGVRRGKSRRQPVSD